ncbi:MAG: hypothetical protein ACTSRR_00990 [Candidatus Heimdallarchaeaceae archaeon]
MRMNLTTQLVLKISNILPKLSYFVPGKAHPDVVKLCVEELKKSGFDIPMYDYENDGYQWVSWTLNEILIFDFVAFNEQKLILGECRFYRDSFVPIEDIKDFIERITRVKPEGRRIHALFISNLPINSEGYSIINKFEDINFETVIASVKI